MLKIERIKTYSRSFYELALIEFPKINEYLTEYGYEVIYKKPYTYIIKNGEMWFSKCMDCDVFSEEEGLFITFYKMKDWDLPKFCKQCKISDLKPGDKFKLTVGTSHTYTCDVKSRCYVNVFYCFFNRDNAMARFDGDTMVFKIN